MKKQIIGIVCLCIYNFGFSQSKTKESKRLIEKTFPSKKEINVYEKLLSEKEIKVTIESRYIDDVVTQHFKDDKETYIYHYRDKEQHLFIQQHNNTLVDTVFKKEDFKLWVGSEFLKLATLYNFDFIEEKDHQVVFQGSLNKPETDWVWFFYLTYNLKTKSFQVVELPEHGN